MNFLELKVPPPIVVLALGIAMWALSRSTPALAAGGALTTGAAIAIALVGLAIGVSGARAFHRAQTTSSPLKPETTSSLVTDGIYRITRNPMYVGLVLLLVAWTVYLVNPWCAISPVAFVAYITRFQIKPEERTLTALFGDEYSRYTARVRRWL